MGSQPTYGADMDAETFRQRYQITTVRGDIVAQSHIWRTCRSLAHICNVTRGEVYALLNDDKWMRPKAGQIPTRVGEEAVMEVIGRRGSEET